MAGHVFLCYSRGRDTRYVHALAGFLRQAGLPVWVDDSVAGDRWTPLLQEQIDTCAAFVVVMSPDAEASGWVDLQIGRARETDKPILPMLLAGAPLPRVANLPYEDVTGAHMPRGDFVTRLRVLQASYVPTRLSTVGATAILPAILSTVDDRPEPVTPARGTPTTFASGRSAGAQRRHRVLRGLGAAAVWATVAVALLWSAALLSAGATYYLGQLDRPDAHRWTCAQPATACGSAGFPGYGFQVDGSGGWALLAGAAVGVFVGLLAGLVLPRWMRLTAPVPVLALLAGVAMVTHRPYSTGLAYLAQALALLAGAALAPILAGIWARPASGTRRYSPMAGSFLGGGLTAAGVLLLSVALAIGFDLTDGPFRHTNVASLVVVVVGYAGLAVVAGAMTGTAAAICGAALVVALRRRRTPRAEITARPGTARRLAIASGCVLAAVLAVVVAVGVLGIRHGTDYSSRAVAGPA